MLFIILLYLLCGALAGLLGGLLGIGGGLVIVPLLNVIFAAQYGLDPDLTMRLALGTSLSSILFTSVSSALAHSRRGSVDWGMVRRLTPTVLLGTLLGSLVAGHIPGFGLRVFFVLFLLFVATQMLLDFHPKPGHKAPGKASTAGAGLVIGGVSSLVGLGGGTLSVPYLRWSGFSMHQAVGTSSAIAWPIAIAGTIGYIVSGWMAPGLPPHSLGYVNWAATLGIACTSIFFAPLGARLSHALPTGTLRKIFAVFLYITALNMLRNIIF